jgi:hypothetical protein
MEEEFRAALLANAGLAALVSARIEWGLRAPQSPSVRLQVISGVRFYTHGGRDGMTPYLVQADCFGARYGDAKKVARALEAAAEALGLPHFDSCFVENERDDQDVDAANKPIHRTSLDLRLWHHAS